MNVEDGLSPYRGRSILVVEDDARVRENLHLVLEQAGFAVRVAEDGESALASFSEEIPDLAVVDYRLPGMDGIRLIEEFRQRSPGTEVIMITGFSTLELVITAVKRGAFYYVEKPFRREELLLAIERAFEHQDLVNARTHLSEQLRERAGGLGALVGRSKAMRQLFDRVRSIADTDATVLLCGESGTGKELVAHAIHELSRRSNAPFERLNCAAVPADLLESELFGHERGAFTGAVERRIGRFERANGGTLLLDEITEMAPRLQPKLLRVLQEGEFQRVGGHRTLKADVRIISATNRDVLEAVRSGQLRRDLYYRLRVVPITIPPLRERKDDIPLLAQHFAARFAREHGRPKGVVSPEAMRLLLRYHWPGNVRELSNVVEHAILTGKGPVITASDVADDLRDPSGDTGWEIPVPIRLRDLEELAIRETLKFTGGNKSEAARLLGISRDTLYEKLRRGPRAPAGPARPPRH